MGSFIGSAPGRVFRQTFDVSATFEKPAGFDPDARVLVEIWGSGRSGARRFSDQTAAGGDGGAYVMLQGVYRYVPATVPIVIGAGASKQTRRATSNNNLGGGVTSFGPVNVNQFVSLNDVSYLALIEELTGLAPTFAAGIGGSKSSSQNGAGGISLHGGNGGDGGNDGADGETPGGGGGGGFNSGGAGGNGRITVTIIGG